MKRAADASTRINNGSCARCRIWGNKFLKPKPQVRSVAGTGWLRGRISGTRDGRIRPAATAGAERRAFM